MKKIIAKASSCLIRTKLPRTTEDFETWSAKIYALSGLERNGGLDTTLAQTIQRTSPSVDALPLNFFVVSLNKALANLAAFHVMQDAKVKEAEAQFERDQDEKQKYLEELKAKSESLEPAVAHV